MTTRLLASLLLVAAVLAACPSDADLPALHAGSVAFAVRPESTVASQTYAYQFDSAFSAAPSVALGTSPLTQPSRTSP